MKILYTNFHPRNGGGHASYVASLASGLQGAHEITVATPGTSRLFEQVGALPGVERVDCAFDTRLLPMTREVAQLRRLLREQAFDIVHVNGSADHRQVMLARTGLRVRPRIIFTKHNTMPVRSLGNRLRARLGTDGVIGVSAYVSGILEASPYGRLPIATIHHGVDTDRFRPRCAEWMAEHREQLLGHLPPDSLVLASVGGTDREKGWLYLAHALARLPQAQRDRVRLLVAGDPPRGALRRDFERLGLDSHVVFPGLVPDPETVLGVADIGFVLSEHEACSFAACESLACGLPTLVSDAGGLPEVVRHGVDGWITAVGDVPALEGWLLERLAEPPMAEMSAAARARAQEHFSLAAFVEKTAGFYDQVCR